MSSASVPSSRSGSSGVSPVALFVYNRADNMRATLRALLSNTLAPQTDLYVFSDGGRDDASWKQVREVRALLHDVEAEVARARTLNNITIVERPVNYYLERNIIEGIAEVFRHHDTIIVLEDDIVTGPHFLEFMNDALHLYRDEPRVMHVSGFTRLSPDPSLNREGSGHRQQLDGNQPSQHPSDDSQHNISWPSLFREGLGSESFFSPFMAGWGWGTWRDRWHGHFRHYASRDEALAGLTPADLDALEYGGTFHCLQHLDRQPIPWDICWGIAIYRAHGLCLYPTRTLVRNIGLDSGTHFGRLPRWLIHLIQRFDYDREPCTERIPLTYQEPHSSPAIEAQLKEALADWGIRYTWFGKLLRRIVRRRA